jgi:S-DNA-T family DNA segregation ATPase FtsK/SpoIIIE
MKKGKEETNKKTGSKSVKSSSIFNDERIKFVTGILITGFAVYLLIAFISYLFSWKTDLSFDTTNVISGSDVKVQNWSGKSGFWLAKAIVNKGFGLASLFIPVIIAIIGLYLLNLRSLKLWKLTSKFAIATIILSLSLAFIFGKSEFLGSGPGGAHGYLVTRWLNAFMGKIGTGVLLVFLIISFLVFALKMRPDSFGIKIPVFRKKSGTDSDGNLIVENDNTDLADLNFDIDPEESDDSDNNYKGKQDDLSGFPIFHAVDNDYEPVPEKGRKGEVQGSSIIRDFENEDFIEPVSDDISLTITKAEANDLLSEQEVQRLMQNYDPKLDLSHYKYPPVSLLKDHKSASAFNNTEVVENKENIIKTLADHKVSIKHISATVGPTVTLYEIVPERGVRLARIKSLENDIALNLSALGIRIIAPIPGRGTVGIEVPNKNPEMVSMRSLISSKAFQESKFDLPLALGRTITNDPYIVDLTKMPHLLVAGATGQGKSVGINAIITSILYKKHPSEVKFVLIDPKRVELPLYVKIERHFLAKLPGEEEAIITDTQKVINTLNSLCIEMDNRLELLKLAQSRNLKEYNEKFTLRKLNPEKGHKYMPYIVLIIDEFADLIMTAGREIEGPIGRLAQLARAIGIHLIISTQRPSANIITGFIKANFPTRIAFRVFSSIDSRTILDSTGADRLVGRGDMLVSSGNEPVRVQCAFIDTPEIEELTDFIGSQQGYPDAMHLPEYIDDSDASIQEIDLKKRDNMFNEAARLVVMHQQGSTSLIQRKMAIGYNRAGRIIDQLEAARIVGPFEGSKARDVLISDMTILEQILSKLE